MKTNFVFAAVAVLALTACQNDLTGPMTLPVDEPAPVVTLDPGTGEGFVGKGDVQYTFGWNNKQLQENAATLRFQVTSVLVSEVSWICSNSNNEHTQPRAQTTTASVQGVFSSVTRDRNQITGFILTGYSGNPVVGTPETVGPTVNTCPSGPWTLTTPAGAAVVSSEGGLQVRYGDEEWTELLIKPEPII